MKVRDFTPLFQISSPLTQLPALADHHGGGGRSLAPTPYNTNDSVAVESNQLAQPHLRNIVDLPCTTLVQIYEGGLGIHHRSIKNVSHYDARDGDRSNRR